MRVVVGLACAGLVVGCLGAPPGASSHDAGRDAGLADGECPAGWTRRARVELVPEIQGPLEEAPVQLALGIELVAGLDLAEDLSDLRARDSEGQPLELELEASDDDLERVWVRIHAIDAAPMRIWIFGGNARAIPDEIVDGVWDGFYRGVWHLDEGPDGVYEDATPFLHHAYGPYDVGPNDSGPLGSTVDLAGDQTGLEVEGDQTTAFESAITVEAVVRSDLVTTPDDDRFPIYAPAARLAIEQASEGFEPTLLLASRGGGGSEYTSTIGPDEVGSDWHYLVGTFGPDQMARLYVDGSLVSEQDQGFDELYPSQAVFYLGSFVDGQIDELRVSNVARSPDYVTLQDQVVRGSLVTVGDPEACP